MADILTAEQQAAVENRGRSLLVSAAAGSGKTKVLVERLFSYVEGGEANLDDFLIITYTRAAAAELRGKIAKVLGEKLQEDPLNAHLQRQLLRVYRADIKTVDAFCTALLRENCHLLREDARGHALRPDFRVLDENEAQLLRERVLARTLDEFYETMREGDGASLLADTLGAGRDDRALGALVLELHGKLQAQPYMDRWLASQEQLWHDLPPRVEDTVYGKLLLSTVRRKALHCAALLRGAAEEMEMTSDAALADKYAPLFLGVAEQFGLLAASAEEDWDAAAKRRVDFPRLTAVRKCGDEALKAKMQGVWNGCKKTAKGFDEVFSVTSAEAMEDLRAMAPAMLALLKLTADFSRAYQDEKRRRNAADFSDQEHEAIDLLLGADGQPTDLARTVAQRYREIMVDEYQDTNEVQNCIFSAISREGKNLFTVGDVKHLPLPARRPAYFPRPLSALPARRRRGGGREREAPFEQKLPLAQYGAGRGELRVPQRPFPGNGRAGLRRGRVPARRGELSREPRLLHGVPFCGDVRAGERHGKAPRGPGRGELRRGLHTKAHRRRLHGAGR